MSNDELVDIVVYGATSKTGGYVVPYLLKHPEQPSFALAGRSHAKLSALASKGVPSTVPLIVADSSDSKAIAAMVKRGRLVLNLAGPFNLFNARGIIEECIKQGKHYTDITGESGFYKSVVEQYHDKARKAGVVIAPTTGFDSMPFDLGAYLAVQHLKSHTPAAKITNVSTSFTGIASVSKGTLMSAVDMASGPNKWQMKSIEADAFSPIDAKHKMPWGPTPMRAPGFGGYMAFTPFSPHNHRIVNRTFGLLQAEGSQKEKLGELFQYADGMVVGSGYWIVALFITVFVKMFSTMLIYFPPARSAIRALPDGWAMDSGYIQKNAFVDARTVAESQAGEKAMCKIYIKGDAGYAKTAVMITEASMTILKDSDRLHPIAKKGGVMTTALLGPAFPERLVKEGSFKIECSSLTDADEKKRK